MPRATYHVRVTPTDRAGNVGVASETVYGTTTFGQMVPLAAMNQGTIRFSNDNGWSREDQAKTELIYFKQMTKLIWKRELNGINY